MSDTNVTIQAMPALAALPALAHLDVSGTNCSGEVGTFTCFNLKITRVIYVATNGATPLYFAAEDGEVEVVRALVEAGANLNQVVLTDGATPLCIAAQNGEVEVVRALVEAGADINQAITDGATPLYIAAQKGEVEVVHVLVEAGADINQVVLTDGSTPL